MAHEAGKASPGPMARSKAGNARHWQAGRQAVAPARHGQHWPALPALAGMARHGRARLHGTRTWGDSLTPDISDRRALRGPVGRSPPPRGVH